MGKKIKHVLDKLVDWTVIILLTCMIIITFGQVVCRYVLQSPPNWTDEVARYMSVWLTFLGAAIAFRLGAHLGVDYFVGLLPGNGRSIAGIFINIVLCIVLFFVITLGYQQAQFVKIQLSPALRLPMNIPYLAIPVGGALMLVEVLNNTWKEIRKLIKA
ncbi:MAG: TRAP transporter small permease [Dehalobacterium sp.]